MFKRYGMLTLGIFYIYIFYRNIVILQYINVVQHSALAMCVCVCVCVCVCIPSFLASPPSHPSRSPQSTQLNSLQYTTGSH